MLLREFIASQPYGARQKFRLLLAEAHGCSVHLVRKWEQDPAPEAWDEIKRRARICRHPADLESIAITERITGMRVTRYDLRPECWQTGENNV